MQESAQQARGMGFLVSAIRNLAGKNEWVKAEAEAKDAKRK